VAICRSADHGADEVPQTSGVPGPHALLALYPGLRQTGWAVFAPRHDRRRDDRQDDPPVAASGVIALKTRRKVEPTERIAYQLEALNGITAQWRPGCAVRSEAGGMNWRVPGRDQLEQALLGWTDSTGLPLIVYAAPEVRAAVAGQPNASKDALGYAVMLRLGLIGQSRATAEWEAIAVGYYHLQVSAER
jgi:Holliday junction resolvasome RuvABC endonuclease subunit